MDLQQNITLHTNKSKEQERFCQVIAKILIFLLVFLTLFSLVQVYYRVIIHLALLIPIIFISRKNSYKIIQYLLLCFFVLLTLIITTKLKGLNNINSIIGLFIHYSTWPIVFLVVLDVFSTREIKVLLVLSLFMIFVGNILSIVQIIKNPDISRLLAGVYSGEEQNIYFKKGVGGYGHVYAITFITFAVTRWFISNNKKRFEKFLLFIFLCSSVVYIVLASYTIAILLTMTLIFLAFISNTTIKTQIVFVVSTFILILLLGSIVLNLGYNFFNSIGLHWVATRLNQLLSSINNKNFSELGRYNLYLYSISVFKRYPVFGGIEVGNHSFLFDSMGMYGLLSVFLFLFLKKGVDFVMLKETKKQLMPFFIIFAIFSAINTINLMQIPTVVLFLVPLTEFFIKTSQ